MFPNGVAALRSAGSTIIVDPRSVGLNFQGCEATLTSCLGEQTLIITLGPMPSYRLPPFGTENITGTSIPTSVLLNGGTDPAAVAPLSMRTSEITARTVHFKVTTTPIRSHTQVSQWSCGRIWENPITFMVCLIETSYCCNRPLE